MFSYLSPVVHSAICPENGMTVYVVNSIPYVALFTLLDATDTLKTTQVLAFQDAAQNNLKKTPGSDKQQPLQHAAPPPDLEILRLTSSKILQKPANIRSMSACSREAHRCARSRIYDDARLQSPEPCRRDR